MEVDFVIKFPEQQFKRIKFSLGVLFATVVFLICRFCYSSKAGVIFFLLFIVTGFVEIKFKKTVLCHLINVLWALLLASIICVLPPIVLMATFELHITPYYLFLNVCCVWIVIMLMYVITTRWKTSVCCATAALYLLATINIVVYWFRGKELNIMDFLSLGTALSVVDNYELSISAMMAYSWFVWLWVAFVGMSFPAFEVKTKRRGRAIGLAVLLFLMGIISLGAKDIAIGAWGQEGTSAKGYYLNFYLGMRDARVKQPEEYSVEEIHSYEVEYSATESIPHGKKPNVIIIMDEAFGDFRIYGKDISTNQPVTPFLDALVENCVRGYALSSVFGGNTANSEFELLTSNSMAFLPSGSVPYQQYIHSDIYSLAWYLRSQGYTGLATHPYYENGWSRKTVYPWMGFDKKIFLDDYPQENLIRGYVSDREMFETVLDILKQNQGKPLFCFGITMQNHGGYTYASENWSNSISLEGYTQNYPQVEQYLSLIHETDKAMEYFITALEEYPEDTIVLFFGDHLPKVEPEWYDEIGIDIQDDLTRHMMQHTVPFYIWANYDIIEEKTDITSINYLAGYLLEVAGLGETPYYNAVSDIRKAIPAINAFGFYSTDSGCFLSFDKASEEEREWLQKYKNLQYNNIFDTENRSTYFYGRYIEDMCTMP